MEVSTNTVNSSVLGLNTAAAVSNVSSDSFEKRIAEEVEATFALENNLNARVKPIARVKRD